MRVRQLRCNDWVSQGSGRKKNQLPEGRYNRYIYNSSWSRDTRYNLSSVRYPRVLSLAQIKGLQVEHKWSGPRIEGRCYWRQSQWTMYVEHQSSTLQGDTKSTLSGSLDEGENGGDDWREGGNGRDDVTREGGNGGDDMGVEKIVGTTWGKVGSLFTKINNHVSLKFIFFPSPSSHHLTLVSYLYLRFFTVTTGLWVDLVSPSNVELWRSTYCSLTWCQ